MYNEHHQLKQDAFAYALSVAEHLLPDQEIDPQATPESLIQVPDTIEVWLDAADQLNRQIVHLEHRLLFEIEQEPLEIDALFDLARRAARQFIMILFPQAHLEQRYLLPPQRYLKIGVSNEMARYRLVVGNLIAELDHLLEDHGNDAKGGQIVILTFQAKIRLLHLTQSDLDQLDETCPSIEGAFATYLHQLLETRVEDPQAKFTLLPMPERSVE